MVQRFFQMVSGLYKKLKTGEWGYQERGADLFRGPKVSMETPEEVLASLLSFHRPGRAFQGVMRLFLLDSLLQSPDGLQYVFDVMRGERYYTLWELPGEEAFVLRDGISGQVLAVSEAA